MRQGTDQETLPLRIDRTHLHLSGKAIAFSELTALTWWTESSDDRERRIFELHADPGGSVRFRIDRDAAVALSDQIGAEVAPSVVARLLSRLDGGDTLRFPDAEGSPRLSKDGFTRKGVLHRGTQAWDTLMPATLSGNRVYFKERGARAVVKRLASVPVEDPIGAVLPFLVDALQSRAAGE